MNKVRDLWRGSQVKAWIGIMVTLVIIVLVVVMLRSSLDEPSAKNQSSSSVSSTKQSLVEDPVVLARIGTNTYRMPYRQYLITPFSLLRR